MTYDDIWRRLAKRLGASEARAVARMLLEEKFGMSFADILCGGVESLQADAVQWLECAVRRLEASEPVQYVLGEACFCGNRFSVAPGVLIPRPETEWLVDTIVSAYECNGEPPRILDIGTGSGCIAVSVKKALPSAYVEAWDISADALRIASGNAESLSADVVFCRRDALGLEMPEEPCWDVIVSNPPYVCARERESMDANVLNFEPSLALFVPDDDPLLFYRSITRYAKGALRVGGRLLFECNTLYAADTAVMMGGEGMRLARVCDDCFGKPRFAVGTK